MEIVVNGNSKIFSCDDTDKLRDIVNELLKIFKEEKLKIIKMKLDGKEISSTELEKLGDENVKNYKKLEIRVFPEDIEFDRLIMDINESVQRLKDLMQLVSETIQKGATDKALEHLKTCMDSWYTLYNTILKVSKLSGISLEEIVLEDQSGIEILTEPKDSLRELEDAIKSKDFITIADILEFEISPGLEKWARLVERIKEEFNA